MKSGLHTRIDRLARRIGPTVADKPSTLLALYEVDESEIIALSAGPQRVTRIEGETLGELVARARAETGCRMLCACYVGIDRYDDGSTAPNPDNANNGVPL